MENLSERELGKVALEVVASYDRVFIDDYESFVIGPS